MTTTAPTVELFEEHRSDVLAHCYRFFGHHAEAEDATQETMLRAWQRADGFEGRSSVRTWLHRIATHVCLDMAKAPQRRALPTDLGQAGEVPSGPAALRTLPETTWIGPIADHLLPSRSDPAEAAELRASVRLAFVAALQVLPPRQRAVLLLRDVLAWSAAECAETLDLTVASVNSALARARRSLAPYNASDLSPYDQIDQGNDQIDQELTDRYVDAFERYDVAALVELITQDAEFSMPPFELWLKGSGSIQAWWAGPGTICRDSRTIRTRANGRPAVAVYHRSGQEWTAFAIHVLERCGDRIGAITHFMGPAVFAEFGLPKIFPG